MCVSVNRKTSVKNFDHVKPFSRAWHELPSKRERNLINDTQSDRAQAIDDEVELGCTMSADHKSNKIKVCHMHQWIKASKS